MKKTVMTLCFFSMLVAFAFIQTADATPKPSWRGPLPPKVRYHRPYVFHHSLPPGYITLKVAKTLYYYLNGAYYQHTPSGYIIVPAPRGAVIRKLPPRHRRIPYGGKVYYWYNNAYYVEEPKGYTVVSPPPQVVISNPPAYEAPEKTIVVTVPNPNGSYILITLEKYSNGYKGPSGEFYPDYPSIDQLKTMYSK